jgi:hypothetical protein
MPYENVEVGDILFFSDINNDFAQYSRSLQRRLSCLLFSCCCNDDYRMTHVAICVEANKNGTKIAHLRDKMTGYEIKSLSKSEKNHTYEIIRPKNDRFKQELVRLACDTENKAIQWEYDSYIQSASCCGSQLASKKTKNGFSTLSYCSLFTYEAINLAAEIQEFSKYKIKKENLGVMQLFWALTASKNYHHLKENEKLLIPESKQDNQRNESQTPLLTEHSTTRLA